MFKDGTKGKTGRPKPLTPLPPPLPRPIPPPPAASAEGLADPDALGHLASCEGARRTATGRPRALNSKRAATRAELANFLRACF